MKKPHKTILDGFQEKNLMMKFYDAHIHFFYNCPAMEKDRDSYRDFTGRYQDRILFGSDAIIGEAENVQSALKFLEGFLGREEIFYKLVNENYLTFHRASNRT